MEEGVIINNNTKTQNDQSNVKTSDIFVKYN